jgi:hypothetical protein
MTMNYLERNRALIGEIRQNLALRIGNVVGRSDTGTIVYSLGHYRSGILGRELHLVFKDKEGVRSVVNHVVAKDLALFRFIEERFPHLLLEFPVVYGMMLTAREEKFGILCEDFSEGGKYNIFQMTEGDDLPMELIDISEKRISKENLATACFSVNGRRRIGDFEEFYGNLSLIKLEELLQYRDIYRAIEGVTLKLSR